MQRAVFRVDLEQRSTPLLVEKLAQFPEALDEQDGGDDAAVPVEVNHDPVRFAVAGLLLDDAVKPLASQVFLDLEGPFPRRSDGPGLLLRGGDDPCLPVVAVPEAEFQHGFGLLLGRLHDLLPAGVEVGHGDLPGPLRPEVEVGLDSGSLVLMKQATQVV